MGEMNVEYGRTSLSVSVCMYIDNNVKQGENANTSR